MSDWATVTSPFLSQRAYLRAPQALAFARVTGAAMMISRDGEIALFSGTAHDVDACQIAQLAVRALRARQDDVVSFPYESCCVHVAALGFGWALCVISNVGAHPAAVLDRVRRARRFLAIALRDGRGVAGGGQDGESGAPARVWAYAPLRP